MFCFLVEPLPLMEVFEAAGHRAKLRVQTVCEHDEGVVVEEVRNGVKIVLEVPLVGGPDVLADVLQLHEQQRHAIDEANDVGSAAVQVAADPQFAYTEKLVPCGVGKVKYPKPLAHQVAIGVAERDLHAVAEQVVLVPVGRRERLGSAVRDYLANGIVVGRIGESGIELHQLGAEASG